MSERLTERDEYGNADIIGVDSCEIQGSLGFDELNLVTNALNKLADYEEAELDGNLMMLNKVFEMPTGKFCFLYYHEDGTLMGNVQNTREESERALAEKGAADDHK